MIPQRPVIERRLLAALDASPPRIPVLVGGCGSGRTALLLRLREQLGRDTCQYVDVERLATTPERFYQRLTDESPFPNPGRPGPATARRAFDAALEFMSVASARGTRATFLLDELLELRTFESFPGLRTALRDVLDAVAQSPNRFVLTSRYVSRAHRLLRDGAPHFEVVHVPPLGMGEARDALPVPHEPSDARDRDDLARAVHALTDGKPLYVRAIADMMAVLDQRGGSDPISALSALLAPGGLLATACRFCYELRLHRARGYGALKAILDVLAAEEPLTLTQIAQRLHRTPGSTKDYLSWLEDVDLITARQKRYAFSDPVLRLWVRLNCHSAPLTDEDLAREVHTYALARLPQAEPAMAMAGVVKSMDRDKWGIIEID
jgi:hypothetical protein